MSSVLHNMQARATNIIRISKMTLPDIQATYLKIGFFAHASGQPIVPQWHADGLKKLTPTNGTSALCLIFLFFLQENELRKALNSECEWRSYCFLAIGLPFWQGMQILC